VIDLHLHSTASDGEFPPDEVVRRAAKAGLTTIALTDHDTLAGVAVARRYAESAGVRVISGCEFSVEASWGEMHLLAFFLPDDDPAVQAFLSEQRSGRATRARAIVERLNALGVAITDEDVLAAAKGGAVGRPHVAQALITRGAAASIPEAFDRYLGWKRPAFVPKALPAVGVVTHLVRKAGGVTSAAHLKDRANRAALASLKAAGVDAVEAIHPAHDEATAGRIRRLAGELDLLLSGGSDWHGDGNGPPARAPLGSLDVPEEWLNAIEDLHTRRET
jgi:predicted metal-dependent phosphoesterase TrpH